MTSLDTPPLPPFPTNLLPPWQRDLVEAAATETETRPDLGALAVLAAQATALQRKVVVEQRIGYTQPLALWTMSLLKSGGRKSRVFNLATAALDAWQTGRAEELAPRIAQEVSARRRLDQRLKRAEKASVEAKAEDRKRADEHDADRLAAELDAFELTRAPLLFVTEATPERLEELLAEQGGRMSVLSDENGMIELLSGRYSRGSPNLSSLNTAHDGGRIHVGHKRKEDGSEGDRTVEHAVLTFGLSAQPDRVFSELRNQSAFFDSGFAWRFLFALVPSTLGERTHRTPATPDHVKAAYGDALTGLLNLATPPGLEFPVIHPESEALDALLNWEALVQEPRLGPDGDLNSLESWGSKLASSLCRIAGLFHCAEHPDEPWREPLTLDTMNRAIGLAPYFIAHAKAVATELNTDPVAFAKTRS